MRGKLFRPADALAREHTERAIETIAAVMDDWTAEDRDRIAAANALLDRGHGKPLAAVISVPASRQMQAQLAGMSDAELESQIMDQPLPRLTKLVPAGTNLRLPPSAEPLVELDDSSAVDAAPDPLTL